MRSEKRFDYFWASSKLALFVMMESSKVSAMIRDEMIARIGEVTPALKAESVSNLAMFGSCSRGDARPDCRRERE
jgi:hypothetical protein